MLKIFRRHLKSCGKKSRRYTRCHCPVWMEGTLAGERVARRSMDLTSWDAAEKRIHAWNTAGRIGGGDEPVAMTIEEAITLYLTDAEARGLRPGTVKLHKQLLNGNLIPWCKAMGYQYLHQLDLKKMIAYRASWKFKPITAQKKFERLRSFFLFCERATWITKSPVSAMKAPQAGPSERLPFDDDEVERIFEVASKFNIRGSSGRHNATRVLAFVYVLRYSGLRISDAAGLAMARLTSDGKLFLHKQHKTKVPVFVPLPPEAVAALEAQAKFSRNPDYFFWSGVGTIESACHSWKRTLYRIFDLAEVKGGHAHRFRHTFAVDLLLHDVPLETVSQLLGHRSTKVTEESYSHWVKARQTRLEEAVARTWKDRKPKLKLVAS